MVTMTDFAKAIAVFEKYFKEYDLSLKDNMSIDHRKLHIYLTPSLISDEDKDILENGVLYAQKELGVMLSGSMQLMMKRRSNYDTRK